MLHRHKPLILITIMLVVAALACNLGGRRQVELGETFQSDAGGFILQTIPDYEFEEFFGMVLMTAPGADPDIGPYVIAYGEVLDEEISSQEVLDYMKMTADGFEFGSEENKSIDGIEGLLADFSGVEKGTNVQGKVFVAMPRPMQEFYIIALAPEDEWKDFEPIFDAVLESVSFIDADPFAFDFDDWDDFDDVDLGESVQSDQGGFILQIIPGYEIEEFFGMVMMTSPGADPDVGPFIMAVGELLDEAISSQVILDEMIMAADDFSFSPQVNLTVDGTQGLQVSFTGTEAGRAIQGKMFVATPRPLQEFYIFAMAPQEEWNTFEPVFDSVLNSVRFIDAEPFTFDFDDDDPIETVEEIRQWAVFAEASSEYEPDDWSAMQATGEPAVNVCEENPRAWASLAPDTEEYLVLYYETPVNPTELVIYQSHNPSQIVEINFIDTTGETWLLWYGDPHESEFCPDVWTHTIELDEVFYTDTVVIWVDQSILGLGWVEIDAVELVGYPMGVAADPVQPEQPAPLPIGDIPTNYTGLMAGPVYQGWISIVLGETMEEDLDRIMTVDHIGTDTWPFRDDHKISYRYQLPWDGMTALISVTEEGWVYRMRVTADAHPNDFALATVNRENYDELKAIYDRDKAIPYAVMANMLESPGFLRETFIGEDDGIIREIFNWYNADGDRISGTFLDGVLTGAIGLNYIEGN